MKKRPDREFLLELGVEEIPSGLLPALEEQLEEIFLKELEERRILYSQISTFSTPSRLVVFGKLSLSNLPQVYEVQGPSSKVAFDQNGKPTQAYFGFLKSQQGQEKDLVIRETSRGKYLFLLKKEKPQKVEIILKEMIPQIISKFSLPKYMRWDNSGLKFIRPLRWMVVIYGDKFLRVKLGNLVSSNFTVIRRGGNFKKLKVENIKDYLKKLKREGVVISYRERKEKIQRALQKKADRLNAKVELIPELLSEVANLLESPAVIVCEFKEEFLNLPGVVLLASMAKYQRVFALRDKKNKFLNKFLAVIDSRAGKLNQVRSHYEFVLNARLWDASYFFREDSKQHLEEKVPQLKEIVLHQKLGSIYQKVELLREAGQRIAKILNLDQQESRALLRAIWLSKADLLTRMVYEFPSLEGVMGGIYARMFGEDEEVARAISEHYKPRTNEDDIPGSKLGALLSLLDKCFNLVGFLGIGEIPTGSEDPFALRRQIQALVRILIQYQLEIALEELVEIFFVLLENKLNLQKENLQKLFLNLCRERFQFLMKEEGFPPDLVIGVSKTNFSNLFEVYLRLRKLERIYQRKEFFMACKVVERTANIIKDEEVQLSIGLNREAFREPEEKQLLQAYLENKGRISELIESRAYDKAILLYAQAFYDIIHLFFDRVLVNVEDDSLRRKRKGLLYLINLLLSSRVADLKEMEVLKNARE